MVYGKPITHTPAQNVAVLPLTADIAFKCVLIIFRSKMYAVTLSFKNIIFEIFHCLVLNTGIVDTIKRHKLQVNCFMLTTENCNLRLSTVEPYLLKSPCC